MTGPACANICDMQQRQIQRTYSLIPDYIKVMTGTNWHPCQQSDGTSEGTTAIMASPAYANNLRRATKTERREAVGWRCL